MRRDDVGGGGWGPVEQNVVYGLTTRTNIVATRHVSWAQNIPKMLTGYSAPLSHTPWLLGI